MSAPGQSRRSDRAPMTFAVGTRVTSRPPHRSVRAQFGHTACMGLSLSRGRHAILVVLCIPFFCSTRAASILPPRPHIAVAVARSEGQGRRFFSAAEGLSLTDASTAAGCRRSGGLPRDDPRGACHWPRAIAREPRLYSVEPCRVPTMKQSYASASKAPRRRVHSPSGIAAIAVCGLPPPRIVIGYPARQAQSGAEPFCPFSL
jgi:hypothetical protein